MDLAIFSSQEALSLHFSFKLGLTIQITLKFSHTECKSYACALTYVPCQILLQQWNETTQKSNAENGPASLVPRPFPRSKTGGWNGLGTRLGPAPIASLQHRLMSLSSICEVFLFLYTLDIARCIQQ